LLLPEVTYFQVVFTLPDKLSSLILGNRRHLYRVLMHAAWESLRESIEAELGMQASALLVLHTWNQRLEHHSHVHALVPGSGPSLDGQRWIDGKMTKGTRSQPAKPFLVDNKALGQEFSRRFIGKLEALHRRGKLELEGTCEGLQEPLVWTEYTEALTEHDWCVFIEPPPTGESKPEHVCGYSSSKRTSFLALCKQLCPQPATATEPLVESEQLEAEAKDTTPCCPNCQQKMELTAETRRPSWRDLFYGPDHHPWFES
jgi:hypothetical protein